MTPSSRDIEQISRAQSRQQIVLIILSIAVAACAVATWRAGSALRAANELQQRSVMQQADAAAKHSGKRQLSARAAAKSSAQSQASPPSRERAQAHGGQATQDKGKAADFTNTKTAMVRSGRQ